MKRDFSIQSEDTEKTEKDGDCDVKRRAHQRHD
jgi:hypothetical protein